MPEKALRRRFGAEYKARILREADQATASGQLSALLRREGLSSSHLAAWRKQRDAASLEALAPKRRGRKAAPHSPVKPKPQPRAASPRALDAEERQAVLDALHSTPLADKAPAEAYATLLDEGKYLCSISTMERILNAKLGGAGASRPAPTSDTRQAATQGHDPESGLVVGHHEAPRDQEMDL